MNAVQWRNLSAEERERYYPAFAEHGDLVRADAQLPDDILGDVRDTLEDARDTLATADGRIVACLNDLP